MYVKVIDGSVTAYGALPVRAIRLDTGAWVSALQNASAETQRACGYYPVVGDPKPADTDTHTHDRDAVVEEEGVVLVTWEKRKWTAKELVQRADAAERESARAELGDKALDYLDGLIEDTTGVSPTTQANALKRIDLIIGLINKSGRVLRWIVRSQRIDQG